MPKNSHVNQRKKEKEKLTTTTIIIYWSKIPIYVTYYIF
jgi:hypothetical protein